MNASNRATRFALVAASLPVIVLAIGILVWVTVVVVAVAYSGSSGMPSTPPAVNLAMAFVAGSIFFGWVTALVLAASSLPRIPMLPIVVTGVVGGIAAMAMPGLAKALMSGAAYVVSIVSGINRR
jgi:hypothetical protein